VAGRARGRVVDRVTVVGLVGVLYSRLGYL
jgi:hypothetical protein